MVAYVLVSGDDEHRLGSDLRRLQCSLDVRDGGGFDRLLVQAVASVGLDGQGQGFWRGILFLGVSRGQRDLDLGELVEGGG